MAELYLIDDEQDIRDGLVMALEESHRITAFSNAEAAMEAIKHNIPDIILLDIGLPGMSGIEALQQVKEKHPEIVVIMLTAYEDTNSVISTMKLGAYDYVVKPIYMNSLKVVISNAYETVRLRKEVQALQQRYLEDHMPCFIGESNAIQRVMDVVEKVAKSPTTPILILGETGTGKELLARAIHYRSPNFKNAFVSLNCASLPRDLIESELFGYEKGAFSGARATGKRGLVEEAADGTLFLDEIGDLHLDAQAKLLRFLENGEFYKVGGNKPQRVQVRVVSATNKDIEELIDEGKYRKDLYFRLGVIKIRVPSLNERCEDIIPLARYYLVEFNNRFQRNLRGIAPDAERMLRSHHWRGNIRELKNLMERVVLTSKGPLLTAADLDFTKSRSTYPNLPKYPLLSPEGIDLADLQQKLEEFYIKEALKMAQGNECQAARLLNMNHHTFRYRKKKLGISKAF